MWTLKIRVYEEKDIYGSRTRKFNITLYFYSINYFIKKKKYYFVGVGVIEGEERNKKAFFRDLKKDKRIEKLEINKDFFICIYSETKTRALERMVQVAYSPSFFHLKPVIMSNNGWETWEVASLDRKILEKLIDIAKRYKYELLYFKEKKISNIMIFNILPELTDKQKRALELAVENGYYEYPRKIKLEKLAKLMKVSLSTYQAHLRKAEKKLLPFIARRF